MMRVFQLFQKWNFIYKTRYWDQCFIIPFLWIFWNKKFFFLKNYFLYHHQLENPHKIYERILFLIFTLWGKYFGFLYHILMKFEKKIFPWILLSLLSSLKQISQIPFDIRRSYFIPWKHHIVLPKMGIKCWT